MDEVAARLLLEDLTTLYARAAAKLHRARRRIAAGDVEAARAASEALAECYGLAEQMAWVSQLMSRQLVEGLLGPRPPEGIPGEESSPIEIQPGHSEDGAE